MTVDEIVRRVRERSTRLASGLPLSHLPADSDFSLNGVVPLPEKWRPAAVLVPLVNRASGVTVLLTQRTEDMPSHAGQIAFPGGRPQAGDADAVATALRETEEEVGLARQFVEVIGTVDHYRTGTGYEITPVVGIVTPGFTTRTDPREVADVFEVPLAHFLDEKNHRLDSRVTPQGSRRRFYAMPYGERYIWGATAGMLDRLASVSYSTSPVTRQSYIYDNPNLPFALTGVTDEVSGEERNVAGAAANVEYTHAGADPSLLKELSRDWLDEAALYSQTLKLLV